MKKALVLIDVQHGLFGTNPPPYESAGVVDRINALTRAARACAAPVIWVQHEDDDALVYGSTDWNLVNTLEVEATDLTVRKKTPDAFHQTELGALLAQSGVTAIVVAGYASEFCVDSSVRRAATLGFAVEVVADAHTTHDKAHASAAMILAHHNATLSAITSCGPVISAVCCEAVDFRDRVFAGGA